MKTKFTKGKWKTLDKATFDSYKNVWSKVLYIDGFNFCMYISGRTEEEVNANAKLIAAAPEMLEALESFVYEIEKTRSDDNILEESYHLAKEAINKATK